jgi:fibro-slime domain-containing protein
VDGGWQACDAPQPGPPTLAATVRDFNDTHPDFEPDGGYGFAPGIVGPDLGPDDKPVYAGGSPIRSTHGATYFDQWYRDMPGDGGVPAVNLTTTISLSLVPRPSAPSIYAYDDDAFFRIDGRLFGNQGRPHNYDFTLELATQFVYTGGEIFSFASDDDSWVFINRKLAVDIGGIHATRGGSVDLDSQSQKLGIVKGQTYPMHLFYAERHVVGAALHIDVSAADFAICN